MFAKVAPLHLFTQPESHNQSFLIKGVGHFSKYERKKETSDSSSLFVGSAIATKSISFLFTILPDTSECVSWLCWAWHIGQVLSVRMVGLCAWPAVRWGGQ